MTGRRFPRIELTEWRSRLLDAHPRLFPDARPYRGPDGWALTCAGRPDVPDGWRWLLGTLCRRLDEAVRTEAGEAVIHAVGEKYGRLRLTISTAGLSVRAQDAVDLATDLAEHRSAHTCSVCGQHGRAFSDGGWIGVWCDGHAVGAVLPRQRDDDVEVTTRFVDGRPVSTARRYLYDEDAFVSVPVPED